MEQQHIIPPQCGLKFNLADDGMLTVTFTPGPSVLGLDERTFRSFLVQEELEDVCIFSEQIEPLIIKQTESKDGFSMTIGGHRDATIEISVANDGMSAHAHVTHACGKGRQLSKETILAALNSAGVTHGVLDEVVSQLIRDQGQNISGEVMIARGQKPEDGKDTQFEGLVEAIERRPRELEHGIVDYREFGGVPTVDVGDRLVRRIPATAGVPGFLVTGDPIEPKPGKDIEFKLNTSVLVAPNDPDVLIANIGGMPVVTDKGAQVEPVMNMEKVDISTGNIHFDGTLVVRGDVHTGMKVTASGDINVQGTVEAAFLDAEGSITVNGGIIGHGSSLVDENGNFKKEAGHINAGGNITAKFVKNTILEAGDSIAVRDTISHSNVTSRNQVVVGGTSPRASIVGGLTRASLLVQAPMIGSPASASTIIEVATDPKKTKIVAKIEEDLDEKRRTLADIQKMESFYKQYPEKAKPGMIDRIVATLMQTRDDITELKNRKVSLEEEAEKLKRAVVIVTNKIFANVTLNFDQVSRVISEDLEKGTFILQDTWVAYRKGKTS